MTNRLTRLFAGTLLFALVPAAARVDAASIGQAGWVARKQQVWLPSGTTLSYVEVGDPAGEPVRQPDARGSRSPGLDR